MLAGSREHDAPPPGLASSWGFLAADASGAEAGLLLLCFRCSPASSSCSSLQSVCSLNAKYEPLALGRSPQISPEHQHLPTAGSLHGAVREELATVLSYIMLRMYFRI